MWRRFTGASGLKLMLRYGSLGFSGERFWWCKGLGGVWGSVLGRVRLSWGFRRGLSLLWRGGRNLFMSRNITQSSAPRLPHFSERPDGVPSCSTKYIESSSNSNGSKRDSLGRFSTTAPASTTWNLTGWRSWSYFSLRLLAQKKRQTSKWPRN